MKTDNQLPTTVAEAKSEATLAAPHSSEMEEAWKRFKKADDQNRLRLGDAADVLLGICKLIEQLPASALQTEISVRASRLYQRMNAQRSPNDQAQERRRETND